MTAEPWVSVEQIAEHLEITKAAVSQWEKGRTVPKIGEFRSFCMLTGASADELLMGRKLVGLEKRVAQLPDALREYVIQAIELAERTKGKIPAEFVTPPTTKTYQKFHEFLTELAESLPRK